MSDVMNYDYGNKRQWRRWIWNRIKERNDHRDGLVIFLAGQDAHDLEYAERKGVSRLNMIAVERDKKVLHHLRSSKCLAIDGDLVDVLQAWPEDRKVSVVIADFCCGMEKNIVGLVPPVVWAHPAFRNTVFVFNFQHGRERSSGFLLNQLPTMHRGELFYAYTGSWFTSLPFFDNYDRQSLRNINVLFGDTTSPAFCSYKSTAGRLYFDTVVFKSPGMIGAALVQQWSEEPLPKQYQPVRRKIAAVLAHHTRRQPGWA